jgi:hypothetical protein
MYVDRFLIQRSVLTSSMFPEKPEQMWFGYRYSGPVLVRVTEWLASQQSPDAYGESLRSCPLAPANGLHLGAALWSYFLATLGRVLEGDGDPPVDELAMVSSYWSRVHVAYRERRRPFDADSTLMPNYRVLGDDTQERIASSLRPVSNGPAVQRLLAGLTSYSWLLESESRQGVFSSGMYPIEGGAVLLRGFNDIAGSDYQWISQTSPMPGGQLLIALELKDVDAAFDLFGSAKLAPENYGSCIRAAAIHSASGPFDDVDGWMAATQLKLRNAHRELYRTVAGWDMRSRFVAGAMSYAKLWAALVRAGGGSTADEAALVWDPLRSHFENELHGISSSSPIRLWEWARADRKETILTPLLGVA